MRKARLPRVAAEAIHLRVVRVAVVRHPLPHKTPRRLRDRK